MKVSDQLLRHCVKERDIDTTMSFSDHAAERMRKRHISLWQVQYARLHGKRYNRAGAEWWVIRRKDIPIMDRNPENLSKLDGLVVCLENGVVATVYRRRRPSLYVRSKPKNRLKLAS